MILNHLLPLAIHLVDAPVDETCHVLVLLILRSRSLRCSCCLVIMGLLEPLFLDAILDVETVCTASQITNEKLATAIVKTDAGDGCL